MNYWFSTWNSEKIALSSLNTHTHSPYFRSLSPHLVLLLKSYHNHNLEAHQYPCYYDCRYESLLSYVCIMLTLLLYELFVFPGVDHRLILLCPSFSKNLPLIHLHTLQQSWKPLLPGRHSIILSEHCWKHPGMLSSAISRPAVVLGPTFTSILVIPSASNYYISCVDSVPSLLQVTEKRYMGDTEGRECLLWNVHASLKACYFQCGIFTTGLD